ncbi:MAG: ABC transporter ATP-binding protein [Deltaproteobacteria bacterium]|jgi:iron complex transport system ATP-binding protein|nr:ABC transporter ATP-binding protein [Deltaproteobacteria bacterium]
MTQDNLVINVDSLGFAYFSNMWIFRGCKVEISKGSIYCILGPNGCGKSTLLNLLLGILKPVEGTVKVKGIMGFVPQIFQVTFSFRALDMVLMGRARQIGFFGRPANSDLEKAWLAMDKMGIADLALRPFYELSGGQRQLTILARALVSEAEILVMDEPTSALDLKNQSLVLDWLVRLSEEYGLTIVFTTHHPHHALAVAQTVYLMMEGNFLEGLTEDVLTETNLEKLYGLPIRRLEFEHNEKPVSALVPILTPRILKNDH